MECKFFATMGRVYTCAVARFAYAGDGEWMLVQGAERASAPCAGRVCMELDCWMNGTGVGCNDFVFLLEFGLAAMVFVLSGRDDDYACRFGSYQDLDCVASSLCFPLFSCVLEP